ncbi:MAG TPA: cation-efflux pump [Clostridiales bacterium]|nr:cation-efflux pump [Clostridiales bacterium]HBP51800.1 cation-efflux pump [Clostridiales bacterium]HCH92679.1 cation-efflux pump [Clostridiales bacterium]
MKFIRKLLIKDYQDTKNPKVRFRYGLVAGVFGIISNALLCVFKLIVGIVGNSITIVADAINNLSDAGSSVVTLVGFKLSATPPDKDHPFGHARYEYVTSLLVSVTVLFIGILLLKSSIEKCITPEAVSVSVYTYVVLGAAIAMKLVQMLIYLDFSKAINSGALKASAADSRNDVLATVAVLISTIVIDVAGDKISPKVSVDGIMGIAVSAFIIVSSILLIKESISPILGEKPPKELVDKITAKILSYDGVIGVHDLVVHSYGENHCFVVAHVEVPQDVEITKSHDVIDNIEHDFWNEMHVRITIHMDPVDTKNEKLAELKLRAQNALANLDEGLSLHDFRIVSGQTHTNMLFDVVIPYDSKLSLGDVKNAMKREFANDPVKYFFVIDVDRKMS